MKKTQLKLIREKLLKEGSISRNWCLQRYMTRLGARINDLKHEGINIQGKYQKKRNGKDYVYFLIKDTVSKMR